jgi:hypothetical protein
MNARDKVWRIPANLPPCWWVAVRHKNTRIDWHGPHDSKEKAETDWIHTEVKAWSEKPIRLEVVRENAEAFQSKVLTGITSQAAVAARWNWFRRHRARLLAWSKPKGCQMLIPSHRNPFKNLLCHRLGGPAVLPEGYPWPTFEIEDFSAGRKTKGRVLGMFVATLDLRGQFALGSKFPAAISLFLCIDGIHGHPPTTLFANAYVPAGIIIPLFAKDRLVEVSFPPGCQLDPLAANAFELPDFPPITVVIGQSTGAEKAASVYRAIDEKEPGTSDWIHLHGLKIGGHERYIQRNVRETMQAKFPDLEWRLIATWVDERIYLGDSGVLYVIAGYDRSARAWRWHCAWECF